MPITEPYTGLFDALATALVDALGGSDAPFTKANQVEVWPPDIIDDLAPTEELRRALSNVLPKALICYERSEARGVEAGDASETEGVIVAIRYAVRTPGVRFDQTFKGDGTPYWGVFPVLQYILNKVMFKDFGLTNWVDGFLFRGNTPIAIGGQGIAAYRAEFEIRRIIERS